MTSLLFSFREMQQEIDDLEILSKHYLHKDSFSVLPTLKSTLNLISFKPDGKTFEWGIPMEMPLKTRVSAGEYENKRTGGQNVHGRPVIAAVSSTWSIIPKRTKNEKAAANFEVGALASTLVRVYDASSGEPDLSTQDPFAKWHLDFADSSSPGCYFHAQVAWDPDLPVPRIPTFVLSPLFAIEFVLGEFFQFDWQRDARSGTPSMQRWAAIQRRRLTAFLDWQRDQVERSTGSPWMALKLAEPTPGLFAKP